MSLLAALLIAGQAAATPDIVVTGQPLAETGRAWRACIARACPPDEEAAAALAHAENQFANGAYADAQATLRKSLDRVDHAARTHPVPVSDLWRAYGRTAFHRGLNDIAERGARQSLEALKAGLPRDDARVLAQRLELGDTMARKGDVNRARSLYRESAEIARRLKAWPTVGEAMLRDFTLNAMLDEDRRETRFPTARAAVARLAATKEPGLAPYRALAPLLVDWLEAKRGDDAALERLVARVSASGVATPTLLFAPPITDPNQLPNHADFNDQWIDIGFWIRSDGRVGQAEILRAGTALRHGWAKYVLRSVMGRRYSAPGADAPELFRIERATLTSPMLTSAFTGSRLVERSRTWQTVFEDLSHKLSRPRAAGR